MKEELTQKVFPRFSCVKVHHLILSALPPPTGISTHFTFFFSLSLLGKCPRQGNLYQEDLGFIVKPFANIRIDISKNIMSSFKPTVQMLDSW